MDLDQLRDILQLVREHELSEFEIEQGGLRLRVRKDTVAHVPMAPAASAAGPAAATSAVASVPAVAAALPVALSAEEGEVELAVVKSPIVGTFYRSPEPDAAAFVELGTLVKKGQV